ncbi:4'-phosphopantetheinyl transferase superfamily protein [Flavobacterium azooxidireducens]|uniref:4'-phosphopantetheinyl transferase superfamily protein n=1 Tax=Flavobacterium azooxidireducens TaxID=1871076 RepID=A0ABY4KHA4_9FLAO|nr:4'-phosphopantetheinyl transferase superfamily protein [Flavobacterium azooxidireducens]UPQ78817.1 4'-phosphopantetheinyl transferase superfamily protein [Flavobacterium azooxidireducens]
MIGNDVIDLALARVESNWQRKGCLDKLFTTKEQNLIFSAKNPTLMVWILWSRKEAVYKIIRQEDGLRGFYPLKIENTDYDSGIVCFNKKEYYTKTVQKGDMLHTIALRNLQFNKISELNTSIEIHKKDEIPFIITNGKNHFISKSHHGRFEKILLLNLS